MKTFTVIGPGRAGGALSIALVRAGFVAEMLITGKSGLRNDLKHHFTGNTRIFTNEDVVEITSDLVLVAVPDDKIEALAQQLAGRIDRNSAVFHLSGALGSEVIGPIAERGIITGSLHPLISISDPVSGAEKLSEAFFCIEGSDNACQIAELIVRRLRARCFRVSSEKKALYHSAAVMAAGHIVALADCAFEAMQNAIGSVAEPREILLPLIESVIANLRNSPAEQALTGPVARGDAKTVVRHLEALGECRSEILEEVYILLARRSAEIASRNAVDPAKIAELLENLNIAKRRRA